MFLIYLLGSSYALFKINIFLPVKKFPFTIFSLKKKKIVFININEFVLLQNQELWLLNGILILVFSKYIVYKMNIISII